jgi:hypothetical protein
VQWQDFEKLNSPSSEVRPAGIESRIPVIKYHNIYSRNDLNIQKKRSREDPKEVLMSALNKDRKAK